MTTLTNSDHRLALEMADIAMVYVFGPETRTSHAFIHLAAIAQLETGYGKFWKKAGQGSNNMGAIQKGSWKGDTFAHGDTSPTSAGESIPYVAEFRRYATPILGWIDLARVAYRTERALHAETPLELSTALYDAGYYEGFGPDRRTRIANHARALERAIRTIREATEKERSARETLERHRTIQRALNEIDGEWDRLAVDGIMGPLTRVAVRQFQQWAGLSVDGIVGPNTWAALEKALEDESR